MGAMHWNVVKILLVLLLIALIAPACCHHTPPVQYKLLPPINSLDKSQDLSPLAKAYKATASIISGSGRPGCAVVLIQNKKGKHLLALTADHCIQSFLKTYTNGRAPLVLIGSVKHKWNISAAIVKRDTRRDLALLRSQGVATEDGVEATLATWEPNRASAVYVIGNPNGKEHNITRGIVSNSLMHGGRHTYRTDADIWYGNSGGGLYNTKGELVGVVISVEPAPGRCVVHGGGHATALPEVSKFLQEYRQQQSTK